jgi:type I restriction enzyme S subunit
MKIPEGYKQTEVGVIPEDWEVMKLKQFATLINGRAFKQTELLQNGKYEVLRVGNFFTSNKWYYSDLELTSEYYVEFGDLMYAWSASFGPQFWKGKKCIYHYHIWKVSVKSNSNKYFLFHLFEFDKSRLLNQTQGGTMFHLTKSGMEAREFPVPPLPEQTAIANALSDMDALIAQTERLIEKKKAIKQGVMQELLQPKEGWVTKKLGEVAEVVGGGTPSTNVSSYWNGEIEWFTPTEVGHTKYLTQSKRKITKAGQTASSAKILPKGSILLTTRAGIGDLGILQVEACTNQGFQSLIAKQGYENEFLYYLVSTKKSDLLQNASGSTFLEISPQKLKSIELSLPDFMEQIRISKILAEIDKLILLAETKLQKLKLQKQGMMQALLTGKIRLV